MESPLSQNSRSPKSPLLHILLKLPGSETRDGRVYSATNTKSIATKTN